MRRRILLAKITLGMGLIAYTRARNAQNTYHYPKADSNIPQSPVDGADKTNGDVGASNNKAKTHWTCPKMGKLLHPPFLWFPCLFD